VEKDQTPPSYADIVENVDERPPNYNMLFEENEDRKCLT
jgi:hypothetical protein